jgi:uncharacterized OB-fold protein
VTYELPAASHTIAEFVHGYEEEHRLRGFRCTKCGTLSATWGLLCPQCGNPERVEATLSGRGKVAAFTVLAVPGDDFFNDAPYAYVVVELAEGGRITGWMPSVKQERELTIGDAVHYVPGYKPGVQFVRDADGASER